MLRLQQVSRLRLVVAVPESEVTGITLGAKVNFSVPALPGEQFTGVVRRVSRSLDKKTRTMPVDLDVKNQSGRLAPGMFPGVIWPAKQPVHHSSSHPPQSPQRLSGHSSFACARGRSSGLMSGEAWRRASRAATWSKSLAT
jgi:multidrug efflux pump subunit AcrA (membrane-fusion protein)